MMNTQQHIDSLFSSYEETPALADFKEELRSNLDDRIASLMKKGATKQAAFTKATEELGDISALAEEISLKKKKEIYSEMYMQTRHYMSTKRVALYVACGAMLGFAVIVALLVQFNAREPAGPMGALLALGGAPILGFVFLGLTQETATHESMPWKRALWYVAASGVFLFGVFTFGVVYFYSERGIAEAIGTLIPFALPGAALGVFLILTEKDRRKPWVMEQAKKYTEQAAEYFANPAQAARFGMTSAAVWIAAIAGFIVLTMTVGIQFSWLAVVAAIVIQLLILAGFGDGRK
jgi:predicted histidine transporter YuiF (NhaC family)